MTIKGQHRHSISTIHWLDVSGPLALVAMILIPVIGTPAAQAQTYTVLHRFKGFPTDGAFPNAGLTGGPAGNLYGTTGAGGTSNSGVVFRLNESGETVLYSFKRRADGGAPEGALIQDSAGNLYGTTYFGGRSGCTIDAELVDCGVVFKLDKTGETILHWFRGGPGDGEGPVAGVIVDSAGNLYGTTSVGGVGVPKGGCGGSQGGCGIVFKLDTTGVETVLYRFKGPDGYFPNGLIRDSAGNFYGTTFYGGASHFGVVFKLDTTGTQTVLYSFTGGADGGYPAGSLIRDSAGNLYGTTTRGGIPSDAGGSGVVFKLDPSGVETVLYSFTGGADGQIPDSGVIRDSAGNFYGITIYGGVAGCGSAGLGCGVVFKLDTSGIETVLYTFKGGTDGETPNGLIQGSAGNFYGTTQAGGAGNGVVFKLQPAGTN